MSEDLHPAAAIGTPAAGEKTPMQEAMQARGNALGAAAQAKENLGRVAAGVPSSREVHVDANGTVLTPREVAEVRANGNEH